MHTPSYIEYICSKTITHIIHPGDMFGKQSCKSLTFENAHKQQSECNTRLYDTSSDQQLLRMQVSLKFRVNDIKTTELCRKLPCML